MNVEVLVYGPIFLDLIFTGLSHMPVLGKETFAEDLTLTIGGSAIVAVGLQRLGVKVCLVAELGNDPLSEVTNQLLEENEVDCRFIRKHPYPLPQLTVALSYPQDRAFITRLKRPEALPDLVEILRAAPARHLHLCSFLAAFDHPNACAVAHAAGATISLDPGWSDSALLDPRLHDMVRELDLFMPSKNELCYMAQTEEVELAAEKMLKTMRSGMIVMKNGKAGASLFSNYHEPLHVAAIPVIPVDTTGAGDAFDAGYLSAWMKGLPLKDRLKYGVVCGGITTTGKGGISALPFIQEVEQWL